MILKEIFKEEDWIDCNEQQSDTKKFVDQIIFDFTNFDIEGSLEDTDFPPLVANPVMTSSSIKHYKKPMTVSSEDHASHASSVHLSKSQQHLPSNKQ